MSTQVLNLHNINPRFMIRNILKELWAVLLLLISVWLAAGLYAQAHYTPRYVSSATLAVGAQNSNGVYNYSTLAVAKEVTGVFAEVFNSNVLKETVQSALGTPSLNGTIAAAAIDQTNLLQLSVYSSNPEDAYRILNAILDNYESVTENLFGNAVLTVLQEPDVPLYPINTISVEKTQLAWTCIAAFLLIGWIAVQTVLKNTVQTKVTAYKEINAQHLVTIPHQPGITDKKRTNGNGLPIKKQLILSNPSLKESVQYAYQNLAAKLEIQLRSSRKRIILVCSTDMDEGKSTVAANLALAMAARKQKVLLVDCDFRRPSISRFFDIAPDPSNELVAFLQNTEASPGSLLPYQSRGVYLVLNNGVDTSPQRLIASEQLKRFLNTMGSEMDCVILDTPPMLVGSDVEALAQLADASVLVIRQNHARLKDVLESAETLQRLPAEFFGYVLNDFV